MYIIIVGGGRTGESLAKSLVAEKNDVVVVEIDEERAEALASKLDALIVKGDGTNTDILRDAGVEKADALAAVTKDDKVNLMACQIAKQMKVTKIATKVNDPENESLFIQAGVDAAISTASAIVSNFKNILRGKGAKTMLTLANGKLEFMEVHVPEKARVIKKGIKKSGLPEDARIVSIERGEEIILPDEETPVKKDDILGIVAKGEVAKDVLKIIRKK